MSECLKDSFLHATTSTTAAREHVVEMESFIRLIKERTRCTISKLRWSKYRYFHKWIVVHCIYMVVLMVNSFPCPKEKKEISQVFSPREFVTGRVVDYKQIVGFHLGPM